MGNSAVPPLKTHDFRSCALHPQTPTPLPLLSDGMPPLLLLDPMPLTHAFRSHAPHPHSLTLFLPLLRICAPHNPTLALETAYYACHTLPTFPQGLPWVATLLVIPLDLVSINWIILAKEK